MLHIEPVDLRPFGVILPSDRVGIVMAQPHVPRCALSPEEPYHWVEEAKPSQFEVLKATLDVARGRPHGAPKTHFTIFPEYAMPGLGGIERVEEALRSDSWPTCTIVIGGTDGLTKSEYEQLLHHEATYVHALNGVEHINNNEWVNCSITWVKAGDRNVHKWVQPKLYPALEEFNVQHEHMFCGRSVYLFEGRFDNDSTYRFATFVCFDWIANLGQGTPCRLLLSDLHNRANGNKFPLTWLFVIQRNPKPSHDHFMIGAREFFERQPFPNADRDLACLIFANTAGRAEPGRADKFGASSLIMSPASLFLPPDCAPTFSSGGPRFRDGCNVLHSSNLRDTFFRERGACIHSFAHVNPSSLALGPAGRRAAVENAHVFPVSQVGVHDFRAPGHAVAAAVKWINDGLDCVKSSPGANEAPLAAELRSAHEVIVGSLRSMPSQQATHAIELAAADAAKAQSASPNASRERNADDWDRAESDALDHLVQSLDILKVGFPALALDNVPPHATIAIQGRIVEIFAIRGSTHQACVEHSKGFARSMQRRVLLVSRDEANTPFLARFGSFLEPQASSLGQEPMITHPMIASVQIGYQDLFGIFRRATTPAEIVGGICAEPAA